jgi:hypothetical protein
MSQSQEKRTMRIWILLAAALAAIIILLIISPTAFPGH